MGFETSVKGKGLNWPLEAWTFPQPPGADLGQVLPIAVPAPHSFPASKQLVQLIQVTPVPPPLQADFQGF